MRRGAAQRRERIRQQRTEASRRFRLRDKAGIKMYHLLLDSVDIEEMLVREELLAPGVDHDQKTVEAALTEFVTRLAGIHFGGAPETGA